MYVATCVCVSVCVGRVLRKNVSEESFYFFSIHDQKVCIHTILLVSYFILLFIICNIEEFLEVENFRVQKGPEGLGVTEEWLSLP